MYKIYANDTLIYDSTIEDYKIGKGLITLELNKSGSFVFSVYPDHFYYDKFVKMRTVITVYKSGRIVFRGRILNSVTDYWNNKVITCEGELGFLRDSVMGAYKLDNSPQVLFKHLIENHNEMLEPKFSWGHPDSSFKKFKLGDITVVEQYNTVDRHENYDITLDLITEKFIDRLGGYIHITHGDDGTDEIPTIHYISDFDKVSTQVIEFGENLKNYTKTVNAEEIATAIIPLGADLYDNESEDLENPKVSLVGFENGSPYIFDESATNLYGWIFKIVEWEDVTTQVALKAKAEEYLQNIIKQNVTIELNAIDLHLLDKNIESFKVGDYIRCISEPHNFDNTMLCTKQTIDLLKPENDTVILGYSYSSFTETNSKVSSNIKKISTVKSNVEQVNTRVTYVQTETTNILNDVSEVVVDHVSDKNNPHGVSLEQIGAMGFHGVRPIKSTSEDTIDKWKALPSGFYWFNVAGSLIDQPSQYGFVLHIAYGAEIMQLWFTQPTGGVYIRSGSASGWARTWKAFTVAS